MEDSRQWQYRTRACALWHSWQEMRRPNRARKFRPSQLSPPYGTRTKKKNKAARHTGTRPTVTSTAERALCS
eukprot:4402044-Prymnesium_polylepis.2